MVRLDTGMDVSWPVPSMLEMLPVLRCFWLRLEVAQRGVILLGGVHS